MLNQGEMISCLCIFPHNNVVQCKYTMKRCCIVIVLNFEVYYQFVLKSQNCKERMCNFYLRKARCLKFNGASAASVSTCQFC